MKHMQLGIFNRDDDDGYISGRRRLEAGGSAQRDGNGALRRQ